MPSTQGNQANRTGWSKGFLFLVGKQPSARWIWLMWAPKVGRFIHIHYSKRTRLHQSAKAHVCVGRRPRPGYWVAVQPHVLHGPCRGRLVWPLLADWKQDMRLLEKAIPNNLTSAGLVRAWPARKHKRFSEAVGSWYLWFILSRVPI